MRVLLDANVPKKLKAAIVGHDVWTARERKFNTLPDGQLLDAMETDFDALVTMDKSLPFQQRLHDRPFAVIVLRGRSNRIADLLKLVPALQDALDVVQPGELREIAA